MRTAAELGFLEDFSAVEVFLLYFIVFHIDRYMIQIELLYAIYGRTANINKLNVLPLYLFLVHLFASSPALTGLFRAP